MAEILVRKGEVSDFFTTLDNYYATGYSFGFEKLEEFAKILVEREEWEAVVEVFLKINEVRPNDFDTYYNIAMAYKITGNREKAAEWAGKAIDLNPLRADEMNAFIMSL